MTFKTSFEFEDGPKLRHLQGRKNSGKKHNHPAEVQVQCMKVLSNFLGKQKYISGEQVSRWAIFVFVRSLAEKNPTGNVMLIVLICLRLSVKYESFSCDTNCICLIWFFQMLLLQSSRRILKVNSITIIDVLFGKKCFSLKGHLSNCSLQEWWTHFVYLC